MAPVDRGTDITLTTLRILQENAQEVASAYEQEFGRVQLIETVRKLLHVGEARPGRVHRAFARITSFDVIYTTNFDSLLEDTYREANTTTYHETNTRPYRVLVGDKQLSLIAGPDTTNIVKMHGDFDHAEDIVLATVDYDGYSAKYSAIATHLSSMLITRTALFLGYS